NRRKPRIRDRGGASLYDAQRRSKNVRQLFGSPMLIPREPHRTGARRGMIEKAMITIHVGVAHAMNVEERARAPFRVLAEILAKIAVIHYSLESARECRRIARFEKKSRLSIGKNFRHSTDARGDDRQSQMHRFEKRERQPFVVGGHRQT